jgi:hypothetical protein
MSGATPADSGLASGLVNTTQQIGGALGVALLAALAGSRTDTLLGDGKTPADAMTGGYHVSFLVATGLEALGLVLGAVLLRTPKATSATDSTVAAPADATRQGDRDTAVPAPNQN